MNRRSFSSSKVAASNGLPRAPIMSSNYVGLSSTAAAKLLSNKTVSISSACNLSTSTDNGYSSIKFQSSNDILAYLQTHPDYIGLPPDRLGAIVAAIISGVALVGSIAVVIVTGGTGAAAILASSMLMCTGATGLQNAVSGTIQGNFSWADFGKAVGVSGALTLVTFGAGYSAGGLAGFALKSTTTLTETAIKAIGTVAGGLVGSGARTGTFYVIRKVEGRPVETIELVMEAAQGFVGGAAGGYLGVKASIAPTPIEVPVAAEQLQVPQPAGNVVHEQVVLEVFHRPGVGDIGLIEGWHHVTETGRAGGAGLVHIMEAHGDIFQHFGFTADQVRAALADRGGALFLDMQDAFLDVVREAPLPIANAAHNNAIQLFWPLSPTHGLKATISGEPWAYGARNIVQANIIRMPQF